MGVGGTDLVEPLVLTAHVGDVQRVQTSFLPKSQVLALHHGAAWEGGAGVQSGLSQGPCPLALGGSPNICRAEGHTKMSPGNRGGRAAADLAVEAGCASLQHLHILQQPREQGRQRGPHSQPGTAGQLIWWGRVSTGAGRATEPQAPRPVGPALVLGRKKELGQNLEPGKSPARSQGTRVRHCARSKERTLSGGWQSARVGGRLPRWLGIRQDSRARPGSPPLTSSCPPRMNLSTALGEGSRS